MRVSMLLEPARLEEIEKRDELCQGSEENEFQYGSMKLLFDDRRALLNHIEALHGMLGSIGWEDTSAKAWRDANVRVIAEAIRYGAIWTEAYDGSILKMSELTSDQQEGWIKAAEKFLGGLK